MRLIVSNYMGNINQINNQMIIKAEDVDIKSLIGKKVVWKSETGREFYGTVTKAHGKHSVKARFTRGLPGQSLGSEVKLSGTKKPKGSEAKLSGTKKPKK